MKRRTHRLPVFVLALLVGLAACRGTERRSSERPDAPPSIVLILTDDQGYGDLSCNGHPTIRTPHLDALAAGGMKLTQFYMASPVCSPSRAALLTGCYPKRVGMHERVVFPPNDHGLHRDEITLADMLRARGYRTGCFGKWHLGHRPGMLPTDQGFDQFEGVPYSNDMARFHREPDDRYRFRLPWMRADEVTEWEPDQRLLTRRTTRAATDFIDACDDGTPFFVYVPYSMPHVPLYASEAFAGRSPAGLYGDVIEEIDHGVGELMQALRRGGHERNTLVIFTSDNGPWLQFGEAGGSAGPLRGGKGTNWEGGQRVPCIVHWPRQVPAARMCHEVVTAMDWLPTIAALTGAELPASREIDGKDIADLLRGDAGARSPHESFLYYSARGTLAGVRRGPWKLLLEPRMLFNIETDIGEQRDVAGQESQLCRELVELARDLDHAITSAARPAMRVASERFDPSVPPSAPPDR